ncbi:hypothetical protein CRUP_001477, partial [Coryphaenoides rupestris]
MVKYDKTPEARPKVVLLALCRTSSSVSNGNTDITGPKISSFTHPSTLSSWGLLMRAPMRVSASRGSPTAMALVLFTTSSRNLGRISRWTNTRVPLVQTWKLAMSAPRTAFSISQSLKMSRGDLPPSSRTETRRRLCTFLPVGTLPVKETLATLGWRHSRLPVSAPPWTTFTRPTGTPASWKISARITHVTGVMGEGFKTM